MANFPIDLTDEDEARFRAAFAGYDLDEVVTRVLIHTIDCKLYPQRMTLMNVDVAG